MIEKYFNEMKAGCLYFNHITNTYILVIRNDKEQSIFFDTTEKKIYVPKTFLQTIDPGSNCCRLKIISE